MDFKSHYDKINIRGDMMITFTERLKAERKKNNITQTQLAEKLYLDRSSISKYESGKQISETPTLEKLADFFDVSIDYLLGKTDIRNYEDNSSLNSINENLSTNGLKTLAALFDEEQFTQDDLDNIENFIKFIVYKKEIKFM